ncbi:alpha/beta fold hydrolase [Maritimibacter sp. UBA3975]|uniref:alpha/beta hydrolase n=1 Tax=Maritimibacter sp. UBA3975 TaxID=1946833 RepID=UPI000C0ADCC2|nr:alpha/beta fold hydrolase [Maritimibacter sp. UBA3975]MAM60323.1 alpha/beta hydrolase [Maritimibacter sp.]|tara:strand:- start:19665 stop:20642 length:978 start_codon:yes stop_codon:yes gene_type:complete
MIYKLLISGGISVVIYFVIAFGLILSQPVRALDTAQGAGLDFERIVGQDATEPVEQVSYSTPDGTALTYGWVHEPGSEAKPLVVMVHGSGWYGGQFDRLARALSDVAEVKTVTLRGHGPDPVRRGDVDYIGQLEDDLVPLFEGAEGRRRILLGHSSGGGLVTRFAGGAHGDLIDGAILLAPFLQYDAPTTRANSGGWAHTLTRRIVGLSMLNMVGIHALDHLTMIQFAMPQAVLDGPRGDHATTAYSWRLNTSYAPRRDYRADIAALPPFLLVAGAGDEAMNAAAYEPLMAPVNGQGQYHVIEGAGHLDIVDDPRTLDLIRAFLE